MHDKAVYEQVERYIPIEEFWWKFEEGLAYFDTESALEAASEYLVGYGADDWSDADHHNVQYEAEQIATALSTRLKELFSSWIASLPIPSSFGSIYKLPLPRDAYYFNFNYTPTLEVLYGIPNEQILYIHGRTGSDKELILGHGWTPEADETLGAQYNNEEADVRIMEAAQILDDYFESTFKPTEDIIEKNAGFFKSITMTSSIHVLGHSLTAIDRPYFETIVSATKNSRPNWNVSYFSDNDIENAKDTLNSLGAGDKGVNFFRLSEWR